MFYLDDRPILVDEIELIRLIRDDLNLSNIYKLRDIVQSGNNIMVTCPCHSEGQERKPSCGIYIDNKIKTNPVHCFTCGYVDTLEGFISECFDKKDGGRFGKSWLESFASVMIYQKNKLNKIIVPDRRKDIILPITKDKINKKHEYMYKRKLTDEIIDKFEIYYQKDFMLSIDKPPIECIVFPVKDLYGNIAFEARRAINTKLFHYPKDTRKIIYGAYECIQDKANKVYVCESIIDALTIWCYGKHAIALNGTGSMKQYKILNELPFNQYVLALDGDDAGNRGRYSFKKHVKNKLVSNLILPKGKDINDLTREEFEKLKETFYK